MRALLDTHILLWALADDPALPQKARMLIEDEGNELYYSAASVWEIAIKHALRPSSISLNGTQFEEYCQLAGYKPLAIASAHACTVETLQPAGAVAGHKDPFDRIMLAQAKREGFFFVTHDSAIAAYDEPFILAV